MRFFSLALLGVCTGCVVVPHRAHVVLPMTGDTVLVGQPITVEATWAAECKNALGDFFDSLTSKNNRHIDTTYACDERPSTMQVTCTSCEWLDATTFAPTEVGTLRATVVVRNSETGQRMTEVLERSVEAPLGIELGCGRENAQPCEQQSLSADEPVVQVWLKVKSGRQVVNAAVDVNDVRLPFDRLGAHFSLADLFPAQREGRGVAPGVYDVVVRVGPVRVAQRISVAR